MNRRFIGKERERALKHLKDTLAFVKRNANDDTEVPFVFITWAKIRKFIGRARVQGIAWPAMQASHIKVLVQVPAASFPI